MLTFFHRNDDRDYDNKTVSNDDDNDMVAVAVTLLTTTTTTTRALPLDNFILQFCTKLPVGFCVCGGGGGSGVYLYSQGQQSAV